MALPRETYDGAKSSYILKSILNRDLKSEGGNLNKNTEIVPVMKS